MAAQRKGDGLRVGRVLGVPVFVQPSWFLFAALVVFLYGPDLAREVGNGRGYGTAVAFALMLGGSVLLHEIGHCVVARVFRLPVRSITITLLAGLTEITEPPQTPAREYAVAMSGPMVSLLLCGVGVGLTPLFDERSLPWLLAWALAFVNGSVAVFNLLPGLPLDGGRVLRSAVWQIGGDPERATRVAARSGQVVGILVVPILLVVLLPQALDYEVGLGGVVFSALVSAFIYAGATQSLKRAKVLERLPAVTVLALARPAIRVPSDLPLSEAVRRAQEAGAQGVVVVDSSDRLEAVVSEAAVLATPQERRPWVTVGTVAKGLVDGMVLDAGLAGEPLLEALRRHPATEYVVTAAGTSEVRVLSVADVARAVTGASA